MTLELFPLRPLLDVPRKGARAIGLVLLVTTLLRIATLFVPIFNTDETYLATQAQVLDHGGRLYLDTADRKPPIVPLLYAATFRVVGSDSLVAVHVLAILFTAATALVIGALARRLVGRAVAPWAVLAFLLSSVAFLPSDMLAATFEVFMLLPACAAFLVAPRSPALAGVLVAIAALTKQTAAITALPVLLLVLEGPRAWRSVLTFALGGAAVIALSCALFGTHELYLWTLGGIPDYLSTTGALRFAILHGAQVTVSFVACHAALAWLVFRARRERFTHDRVLWVWLASSAVAVAAGYRFFGHYYLQLLPPASLLAARAIRGVSERGRVRVLVALTVPAVAGAIAGFFAPRFHETPRYEPIAAYVRAHSEADEHIAIWGNYPEVYWASQRTPSTRIAHTDFLTGVSGGRPDDATVISSGPFERAAWAQYLADLERNPPRLYLDASINGFRHYARHPIARYPELEAWLDQHYAPKVTIEGVTIYERVRGALSKPSSGPQGVGAAPSSTSR